MLKLKIMLRLKSQNSTLPDKYTTITRIEPTIGEKGEIKANEEKLRDNIDLVPQTGLQEQVLINECNLIFMAGSATMGKGSDYETSIATPSGWTKMGLLEVGTEISDTESGVQTVEQIYELGTVDLFEVKMRDGASTRCTREHLWKYKLESAHNKAEWSVGTLEELIKVMEEKNENQHIYIPLPDPVFYEQKEKLPIRPDVFGELLNAVINQDFFIPDVYKFSSIKNRTELLNGIMGNNGNKKKLDTLEYKTISHTIAKDIQELVWGLGGNCIINKEEELPYCLDINFKDGSKFTSEELSREIVAIEYIGKEKCRCIRVSNPNRLYITDSYIVTHNTFAGFMKALQGLGKQNYTARLISKRLQDSKKGGSIIRDAKLIYDGFAGCDFTAGEYPTASWDNWNSAIQLIHANFNTENPSEWEEYKDYCKKNQSSYIYWDELTEIRDFKAFSYMFSRNRDSSGNKPCTVASFNPEHEHWTTDFLKQAGYLGDDWFAIPEMYGVTTYFVIQGDTIRDIIFGNTPEEVVRKAGIVITEEEAQFGMKANNMVKSFTFLSGTAMSNKILVNATDGGSVANLYNVGETERKKIKDGYFGPTDKNELTVSRKMIDNLWENPEDPSTEYFATLDVSSGKDTTDSSKKTDNCVMWVWKGLTAIAIEVFDGNLQELTVWIDRMLKTYGIPPRNFAFDAVAIGYYLKSFTDGIPIIGNSRVLTEYDDAGNIIRLGAHFNLRTQLMSKTKTLLETGSFSCLVDKHKLFPHGRNKNPKELIDILCEEANIFVLRKKNGKDYYRSKDEYTARFKSSPDFMDAFVFRAIFELDARERKEVEVEMTDFDYAGLYDM